MKYSSFERLVLIVSVAAVVGTAIINFFSGPVSWTELIGQILVLAVLAAAVHWGRNGGFLAAAAATVIYAVLAVPGVVSGGVQPATVQLVLVHVVVYGLVGVVGGEVCGRLKYQLASLEGASALDEDTHLYAEPVVHELIRSGLARFHRYATPYAVVEVRLSPGLFADYRPVKRRAMLRRVAGFVRNDVRMVDDIGRADDGRFVVMLTSTQTAGAIVVADRLQKGVRDLLSAQDDAVLTRVLATDDSPEALEHFCAELKGPAGKEAGQAAQTSAEVASPAP